MRAINQYELDNKSVYYLQTQLEKLFVQLGRSKPRSKLRKILLQNIAMIERQLGLSRARITHDIQKPIRRRKKMRYSLLYGLVKSTE